MGTRPTARRTARAFGRRPSHQAARAFLRTWRGRATVQPTANCLIVGEFVITSVGTSVSQTCHKAGLPAVVGSHENMSGESRAELAKRLANRYIALQQEVTVAAHIDNIQNPWPQTLATFMPPPGDKREHLWT